MITQRLIDELRDLGVSYRTNVSLAPYTWYKLGGPAEIFSEPDSIETLSHLLATCHRQNIEVRVLGSGANLLVRDSGVPGVVIYLSNPVFKSHGPLDTSNGLVSVGAGYDLMRLVRETAAAGLAGIEGLAGVPASIGGAIRMNAGGAYGQIADAVHTVTVMNEHGQTRTLQGSDIPFAYRHSGIAEPLILSAELALKPEDPLKLRERVKTVFAEKKQSQPFADVSAGCAFRNPVDESGTPIDSAGRLIDQCGLKGHRVGGAVVSDVHANFMVAEDQATADDLLGLIESVEIAVEKQTGIALRRELVVWP